jgi:hypothetical protein
MTADKQLEITMTFSPTQLTTQQNDQRLINAPSVTSLANNESRQAAFASLAVEVAKAVNSYLRRKQQTTCSTGFNADIQMYSTPINYGQNE